MLRALLLVPILLPALLGCVPRWREKEQAAFCSVWAVSAWAAVLALLPQTGELALRGTGVFSLILRVDGVSRIYLLLIAVIWPGAALYAREYLEHDERPQRFFLFYSLAQGALCGLALSGNLTTFFLFFEAMTLLTIPLVRHDPGAEAEKAAEKYHRYSTGGALAVLAGIVFIAIVGGSGDFAAGPVARECLTGREGVARVVFMIMLMGFSVKGGMFPLHGWLPAAHPVAPAPASAVLSGVITKMGVLGVVRTLYFVAGADRLRGTWVQYALLCLSLVTVLMGSTLALREKKLKKRLAYSSVSQVSYVLFGLFTLTEIGFVGAMLHAIFHSLIKNTLFMGAGAVIHKTGKTEVEELDGLGRRMPYTYAFFAVASLGLVGIPPTGGFISKWYLAQGALSSGLPGSWIGPAVLLLSAVMTAAYLFSIVIRGCFPGEEKPGPRCEASWRILTPMAVYSVLILGLGIFSGGLIRYFSALAAALL